MSGGEPFRLTFLGTGTSTGVPAVGCHCDVCSSADPRDKRLRASVLLEFDGRAVVVDTGTDFRQQALRAGLDRLDAVLFTHAHADHIFGLDDIRPFNFRTRKPVPCYADVRTWDGIRRVYDYIFNPTSYGGVPQVEPHVVDGPFALFGRTFEPHYVLHGRLPVVAFRFGGGAYVTDCNEISDETVAALAGLDVLVLDGLRYADHPTHMTIPKALAYIERIAPRKAYLTHMNHEVSHEAVSRELPANVELAYDGLVVEVPA
jgi:phosphoribosyl 1,2-cyclic phosphate phosphodiesterase